MATNPDTVIAMLVVGIGGGSAVGKTTVAREFRRQLGGDVIMVSLSDVLRDLYRHPEKLSLKIERKENPTKTDLLRLGNTLRMDYCNGILVKMALKEHGSGSGVLIIEGIRTLGEASELLLADPSKYKPFLVYVTANKGVRLERAKRNGISPSVFEEIYRAERTVLKTQLIRKVADYVIVNNNDTGSLKVEVAGALDVLRRRTLFKRGHL